MIFFFKVNYSIKTASICRINQIYA